MEEGERPIPPTQVPFTSDTRGTSLDLTRAAAEAARRVGLPEPVTVPRLRADALPKSPAALAALAGIDDDDARPTIAIDGARLPAAPESGLMERAPEPVRRAVETAQALLTAVRRELERGPSRVRAGRLEYEAARLLESPLGDLAGACDGYLRAHALLPDHLPSIQGARRTLLLLGRARETLPLIDAELRLAESSERRAQLLYEKGCLLEDVLGEPESARAAFEEAGRLGERDATRVRGIVRSAALAGAWSALERTLEHEANAVRADPRHRAAALAARARLLEAHRGNVLGAIELYEHALEAEPRTSAPIHSLKRLHQRQGRDRELIGVLEREAELATDAGVRALCYYRAGRIWLDRLGSLDEGARALERAIEQAPHDAMLLESLAYVYERQDRPTDRARVLQQLAEATSSPAARIGYYQEIAEIHARRLDDREAAIEWYERARAIDAGYLPAIQALTELYTERGDFAKLIEVHVGEAQAVRDPARRAAAHARVAALCEQNFGRLDDAIMHYELALGVMPGHAPSFQALVRLFTQAGRFGELASLYERAVDFSGDIETKIDYLYKLGRLYEDALGSPAQALSAYGRILKLAPEDMSALHAMQRAAERAGLWKELVAALETEANRTRDSKRALELVYRAGEVAELELGDDLLAVSYYRKVLDRNASYAPAYVALGRVFHRGRRFHELLEIYQKELTITPRGPGLAALHYRIGRVCAEELGRDEEAIAAYRSAVEIDPTHAPAIRALEHKLEEKGRFQELVALLELELAALEEPKARARLSLRIGELYEMRLNQRAKALGAYDQALAADPELLPARDGVIRLLAEGDDPLRLVAALESEARAHVDPRLAVAALLRAGEVYRDELFDNDRAIRCFESVLEREPAEVEALFALEPLYAARGDWEKLGALYAIEARVLADPAARVGALRELARLQASGKVPSTDRGRQALGAILQLAPGDLGALEGLERIALAEGDPELLAHVHAQLSSVLSDPASVAAHETRLGERFEALDSPHALEAYRSAIARDPEAFGAVRGFSRIAERIGDPVLLEEAAEHEARVELERERAGVLLVRAAEARLAQNDAEGAVRALSRALEVDPDHATAAERVGELLVACGELDRLLGILTQAARLAKRPERIADLWARIAELYAGHKRDLASGIAALERVQGLVPGHAGTLFRLGDLLARAGQWEKAVERLEQALAARPPLETALAAHLRLAAACADHLAEPKRARRHLDAVLEHDPDHREALERLASIQVTEGQLDAAAETALRLVRVSTDPSVRVGALTLLARVERQRGRLEASAHAYEQAVVLSGVEGSAASELSELITNAEPGSGPSFARYATALKRHIESSGAPGADVYLELSRVLSGPLGQSDEAVHWLERGLILYPSDVSLRAELAERLLAVGQCQRAVAELTAVLAADITRQRSFRQLAEAFRALERPVEATLALGPLVALGYANEVERTTWSLRTPRTALASPGAFGSTELALVSVRRGEDPAARLLAALGDITGKVHPPDLERWNVTGRDRLSGRSSHPVRHLCDRLAAIFGVPEYDVYIHRAKSAVVEVELTSPVSLLVPSAVAGLGEAEQAFLIGRVMINIARGVAAVDRLSPQQLQLLLAAAARMVEPGFRAAGVDEEHLAALSRRVSKALPWIGRGPIEDAARVYAAAPLQDVASWVADTRLTAVRAALLVADDLPSSIALVRKHEAELFGAWLPRAADGDRLVRDLVCFWLSEPAFALRRRLGI